MLKLRAKDAEDIQVVSAVLQDAIVPVVDMAFQPEDKTFIVVAQRLRREIKDGGDCERICSALTIKGVETVQTHGIDQHHKERMLDLLALLVEPSAVTGRQQLILVFAGEARIRLELENWGAVVEDFGEPWPALCHPCHDGAAS